MRDLDPDANFQEAKKYTDQNADFDAASGSRLNNSDAFTK
jgi:hypothetical protein